MHEVGFIYIVHCACMMLPKHKIKSVKNKMNFKKTKETQIAHVLNEEVTSNLPGLASKMHSVQSLKL